MTSWPKRPIIYEINTRVWLDELGRGRKKPLTLATVPKKEWDAITALGCDAVWLMGVWERSPAGIAVSMKNQGLLDDFRRVLPDFTAKDNVGSSYCVRDYLVDPHLGGPEGLAVARNELAKRGLKLILDFVPNHVAPDHPWVAAHADFFVRGDARDLERDPDSFQAIGNNAFACGRDPYFPAWPDVLQLNAFHPGLRAAAIETVSTIAGQCDGVRCDMAMLMINDIFQKTWGERAGAQPEQDYWPELIGAVREAHPDFLFMAEAYWDLEWELQQQGFDYCYDKQLYDRLEHGQAEAARLHLGADLAYQEHLVRFIENHDEPRAAAAFPAGRLCAAAVITLTLPGAVLLHEGQLTGRQVRLPVFLGRRPDEPVAAGLQEFYRRLLPLVIAEPLRSGTWQLLEALPAWEGNASHRAFIAGSWEDAAGRRRLVAVNYAPHWSQCYLRLPFPDLGGQSWQLDDLLADACYERDGNDLQARGLYLALAPWQAHIFDCQVIQGEDR